MKSVTYPRVTSAEQGPGLRKGDLGSVNRRSGAKAHLIMLTVVGLKPYAPSDEQKQRPFSQTGNACLHVGSWACVRPWLRSLLLRVKTCAPPLQPGSV